MRRRSLPPLLLAVCLLGAAGANYGALQGLVVLIQPEPLPEVERVTYLELTPEAGETPPIPEAPKPEDPKEPEPPELQPPDKPPPDKPPEPEAKPVDEPLPEPEPEPEPEPPAEQEPAKPFEFVLDQLKMVEQPDELDEKDVPDDVEYLSNINRDVAEQTRAEITNLQQDAIETQAKALQPTDATDKGTADEDVIAQDEDHKSQIAKEAPKVVPEKVDQRPEQTDPNPKALALAMRELEARDHQAAAEEHEALVDEAADGAMRPDQDHQASIAKQDQQARIDKKDPRYAFKLSRDQLDALYGESVDAPRRSQHKEQSKKKGIWEDAQAHWQSPLENMIPEVQVGNQTALRSKKHPFAKYITQIHRSIHEAWAWGFLEQLDTRGRNHELNDYQLWTRVEIVLTGAGEIDKVMTVHHSGSLAFDAAAREIVYSIGPFPDPPREILSANGKVYIHWAFHRDERACGTFGAQPFVLDNAGTGDRPDPDVEIRPGQGGGAPPAGVRRLSRGGGGGGGEHDHSQPGHTHGAPVGPIGPAAPVGPAAPSPGGGRAGGRGQGGGAVSPPGTGGAEPPSGPAEANDPAAQRAADAWLGDLVAGRVEPLAARSTLPFYSGSTVVARTKEERADVLESMSGEAQAGKTKPAYTKAKVYTAAGLRQVFGSVPAGVQEGAGHVYALTKVRGDYLVVILQKKFGAWRIVGTTR